MKFISFSGGVESTAMCVLYGKGATAIWCDTGAEHELMYKRIDYVEEKLKQLHNGDFNLIRLKPSVLVKGAIVRTLLQAVLIWRFMPSQRMRYCTGKFKIEPIDNFLESQPQCDLLIGLNADEQSRDGNWGLKTNVNYLYPLQDDGYTREDCENILRIHNLHPSFPAYMLRGGCKMCFFKSEKEYKALWYLNRPEFEEMIKFEDDYQDNRTKFFSIMPSGKSLRQLARECSSELFQKELLEIYENYNKEGKSCGAFCHR